MHKNHPSYRNMLAVENIYGHFPYEFENISMDLLETLFSKTKSEEQLMSLFRKNQDNITRQTCEKILQGISIQINTNKLYTLLSFVQQSQQINEDLSPIIKQHLRNFYAGNESLFSKIDRGSRVHMGMWTIDSAPPRGKNKGIKKRIRAHHFYQKTLSKRYQEVLQHITNNDENLEKYLYYMFEYIGFPITHLQKNKTGLDKFTILCPIHPEKKPSLKVSTKKGVIKCFGCGKSGSITSFFSNNSSHNYFHIINIARKFIRFGNQKKIT